jgi:Zn-finger nucleic acid-binding protein
MQDVTMPSCPHCGSQLERGEHGEVDFWSCPRMCGLAMTLSEAHGRLQNDEVDDLWQRARNAPKGPLPSPFGGPRMVRFVLPWDLDEAPDGTEGDTEDLGEVELDVDLDNRFIWFDTGELDELPDDLPDALPTAGENEALERITKHFAGSYGEAIDARDDSQISERIHQQIARRPGTLRGVDRLGRALTSY